MATKQDLQEWIIEALRSLGGSAFQLDVAKEIWRLHQVELERSGDLFYTWQYDFRWEAQKLRDKGALKAKGGQRGGPWEVA